MGEVVAAMAGVHAPQLLQSFPGEDETRLDASRAVADCESLARRPVHAQR